MTEDQKYAEELRQFSWTRRDSGAEIAGGLAHQHCMFCYATISVNATAAHDYRFGWLNSRGEWLCPVCYERIIRNHEDPEIVLHQRDA